MLFKKMAGLATGSWHQHPAWKAGIPTGPAWPAGPGKALDNTHGFLYVTRMCFRLGEELTDDNGVTAVHYDYFARAPGLSCLDFKC